MLIDSSRIERWAIIDRRTVNQVERHIRTGQSRFAQREFVVVITQVKPHIFGSCYDCALQTGMSDAGIQRHEQTHVMTELFEISRQRACNIGETTRLREWRDLRSNECNLHEFVQVYS